MINKYILSFAILIGFCGTFTQAKNEVLNNRPIFGVLLQEQRDNLHQYVASSYVKWLEMAGARVVPIFIKRDPAYYHKLLDKVNGVLMPGGGTDLIKSEYAHAADIIFEVALAKAKAGTHFPIWASCLSFEKLVTFFTGNKNLKWVSHCYVENVSLSLDFPPGFTANSTQLFRNAENKLVNILATKNVTANYHKVCLLEETFHKERDLSRDFRLISTNTYGGITFVSTLEHQKYPIFATQWHPEKNQFEWVHSQTVGSINHDEEAIQVGQYFGNFLVSEGRKNGQHFANETEEAESLIYNFSHNLKYSGRSNKSSFEEIYVWPI